MVTGLSVTLSAQQLCSCCVLLLSVLLLSDTGGTSAQSADCGDSRMLVWLGRQAKQFGQHQPKHIA